MVGVPIERPVEFGTRATLSDTEFTQRQAQAARQAQTDDEEVVVPRAGGGGDGTGPPSHWGERGEAQRQNSLIVDPADGRMPKMTPYGAERMAMRARKSSTSDGPFNSAADLDYYDRCISRGRRRVDAAGRLQQRHRDRAGAGLRGDPLRNDPRHADHPLDGRPAPAAAIRQYMGDARGHWDGDTLVVETTNFNGTIGVTGNGRLRPASDALRVVERFTRTGPDTDPVPGNGRRSQDLDRALDGVVPAQARRRLRLLRVRVPRGQQRDAQHLERRARGGEVSRRRAALVLASLCLAACSRSAPPERASAPGRT
jgi:hypothetical protein